MDAIMPNAAPKVEGGDIEGAVTRLSGRSGLAGLLNPDDIWQIKEELDATSEGPKGEPNMTDGSSGVPRPPPDMTPLQRSSWVGQHCSGLFRISRSEVLPSIPGGDEVFDKIVVLVASSNVCMPPLGEMIRWTLEIQNRHDMTPGTPNGRSEWMWAIGKELNIIPANASYGGWSMTDANGTAGAMPPPKKTAEQVVDGMIARCEATCQQLQSRVDDERARAESALRERNQALGALAQAQAEVERLKATHLDPEELERVFAEMFAAMLRRRGLSQ